MNLVRWGNAQPPNLIAGPAPIEHVAPARKAAEADALRQQIKAFIAAGGRITVLPAYARH